VCAPAEQGDGCSLGLSRGQGVERGGVLGGAVGRAGRCPTHQPPPTAAVIPAYNVARTIGAVVAGTRCIVPDVLVIDDGSGDDTARVARQAGAEVIRHPTNKGKGAAIRTGLRHLAERGFERAVALDADGQHLPDEIPKLLAESDGNPDALVLSVRDKEGQPIAALNLVANWIADWATSLVAGCPFRDTQCGFRVYPIGRTLALGLRGDRMEFETEVLIAARRAGIPVREVATRVYYPPAAERESHYRPLEDTLRIAWVVVEAFWRQCCSLP
jgi:glycosyltransferase involved in cell wall biosynthesis